MSKQSRGKDVNLRAPATTKSQGGNDVLQIYWTPILAKGKVRIYVCDPEAAERDRTLPAKLNGSLELSKFSKLILPRELRSVNMVGHRFPTSLFTTKPPTWSTIGQSPYTPHLQKRCSQLACAAGLASPPGGWRADLGMSTHMKHASRTSADYWKAGTARMALGRLSDSSAIAWLRWRSI